MIQKEVALRLAATPSTSDYGYLSVLTQYFARPEIALDIPRQAFTPPPEVDSALVTLRFPGARAKFAVANEEAFFDFVKLCFGKKRKTLVNNLRPAAEPAQVRAALEASQFLIVICSPNAAQSAYVNEEIRRFKALGRGARRRGRRRGSARSRAW